MPGDVDAVSVGRERDYDVMVVGGGGAGVTAAVSAAAQGASVCILEADSKLGGTTALSHGFVLAADTEILRQHGVDIACTLITTMSWPSIVVSSMRRRFGSFVRTRRA